ncbi:GbsR/MarR family transcriptional regulator [Streptomyces sp. NPDC090442]|uniref:GbsR/MarR family transcriptional regulator n=1 Tax=Streptomyces sp. NPDC090442 TaxID=3365962 RepID=UPI00380F5496
MPEQPTEPGGEPSAAGGDRVVERLAAQFAAIGMSRMSARVYAALLTSPHGALTAAEIGKQLQVSPATVSKAVQYLMQVELVYRSSVPGTRRDRYELGQDLWAEMFGFRNRWLRSLADTTAECVEMVGGEDSEAGARLAKLRDFSEFAAEELASMLERWQRT